VPVAAIGAAASLGSAALQSGAAGNAAKAQGNASNATLAANNALLGTIGNDVNPIIGAGNESAGALSGLLGIGGNPAASDAAFKNYLNSTNYQFQLGQGEQGIEYANAPSFNSSATAKALNNYAQGQAGSALQGYEGLLQNQEGQGLQGSNIYASAGTNLAAQNANARNLAAGATGTAGLIGANAFGSALTGVGNLAGSSYGQISSALGGSSSFNPGQIGGSGEFIDPSALQGITAPPITVS